MSWSDELITEAARFDDEALAHLGNKGLVRRAGKLLTTEQLTLSESDSEVTVISSDWEVRFQANETASKGQCDCPTAGTCQHLIAAIMYLRSLAASAGEVSSSEPVVLSEVDDPTEEDIGLKIVNSLLAIDDATWKALTNAQGRRWAIARADALDLTRLEIETGNGLTVRLPPPLGPVRFMTPDPTTAIVKPSTPNDDRIIAYAILCLRIRAGLDLPEASVKVRAAELPTERLAVAKRSIELSGDAVRIGLSHLGPGEQERFDSLAASARGAKLYRLALIAERISDQIEVMTFGSAEADPLRLFNLISELYVVSHLAAEAGGRGLPIPDHLAGRARAHFEPIGSLRVAGVGHYRWGDSDYGGITGVFADTGTGMFFSLSKPLTINGRRQPESIGWQNVGSVESLTGADISLSEVLASEASRLSSSARTTCNIGGSLDPDLLSTIVWTGQPPPTPSRLTGTQNGSWAAVAVEQSGSYTYDEVNQRAQWPISSRGSEIVVEVGYGPHTSAMINRVEALVPRSPTLILGRLTGSASRLTLFPISMVVAGQFEALTSGKGGGIEQLASEHSQGLTPPSHLDRASMSLLAIGERGTSGSVSKRLEALCGEADRWGLSAIVDVIKASPSPHDALLRSAWAMEEYRRFSAPDGD